MRSPKLWLPPDVPFTVGDVGLSQDVLERAARRGAIVRLERGVYIHAAAGPSEATARHLLAAAARQRLNPDLLGSHGTPALAHDVPLLDAANVVGGHRSARRLAAVLAAVDPRRESPMESFVAGCIHQSDLPQPTPQLLVETPEGDLYGDLGWKSHRLVLECDGMLKYTDPRSLHEEKARETRMRRVAYRVERCGWAGVNPDRVSFLMWLAGVL